MRIVAKTGGYSAQEEANHIIQGHSGTASGLVSRRGRDIRKQHYRRGQKGLSSQISTGESRKVKHTVYHFIGMRRITALPGMPGKM